jgi:hypothetical protein
MISGSRHNIFRSTASRKQSSGTPPTSIEKVLNRTSTISGLASIPALSISKRLDSSQWGDSRLEAPATSDTVRWVLFDAFTVYGLTFVGGLGSAIAGLTMQSNPLSAYMANLTSGAIGFAITGGQSPSNRVEHMAWVAVIFWTLNLTNIALGIQTYLAWIHSGVTITLMAILGGTLARIVPRRPKSTRPFCLPTQ